MGRRIRSGTRRKVRVLLADDHPMMRAVLRLACEERPILSVVGEAGTGPEVLELSHELRPDVLVLDLGLPGMDGLEVARRLKADGLDIKILVVSGRQDRSAVMDSLREGVDGYLDKSGTMEGVASAIDAVAGGTFVFSLEHRRAVNTEIGHLVHRAREAARTTSSITGKEHEVLRLISQGLTTRQIARSLRIAEPTAASHIQNLYRKLEVRNRVQAVRRGAELGLVDLA